MLQATILRKETRMLKSLYWIGVIFIILFNISFLKNNHESLSAKETQYQEDCFVALDELANDTEDEEEHIEI